MKTSSFGDKLAFLAHQITPVSPERRVAAQASFPPENK